MKKIWGLGAMLLGCGVGVTQFACSSRADEEPAVTSGDPKIDDLIGSVPVNSASLDGIGSIGFVYNYGGGSAGGSAVGGFAGSGESAGGPSIGGASPWGGSGGAGCTGNCQTPFYPICTGTLISKTSVLTSRSCAQRFEEATYGWSSLKFAIGPDATRARRIDIVDVEYAPQYFSNGQGHYPDVGVLHLAESVSGVASFPVAVLTDDLVGKPFAGVGFGNRDLQYQDGMRRAGSLTLRATSGALFPLVFGSFDAFLQYNGYYPGSYPGGTGGSLPTAGAFPSSGGFSGSGGTPTGGAPGTVGGANSGGAYPGGAGGSAGGAVDWYLEYLRQQYDLTQLAPDQSYFGGIEGDAQPCGADAGGPVVRKLQGQVRVFGVFSSPPLGACERGGLYASITPETKAFIDTAAQWKDPCTNLTSNGQCVGTTATRCSTVAEGKRRTVKFDCSLLNQVCIGGGNTEVTCTDK